jgi:hypothetical protein
LLGESLAQTITLLTGGKIRTNDEDARFDADGLWLKSAGSSTYRPAASLNFHTGAWTSKLTTAYLMSYYNSSTATEYLNLKLPLLPNRGANIAIESYADQAKVAGVALSALNEDSSTAAEIYTQAGPTGSQIQLSANAILLTNAHLDLSKPTYATGAPVTGRARIMTRSTGIGNSKEQLVVVFKTGAVQVLATEP